MIAVLYIGENIGIFQLRPERLCYRNIINAPAFIIQSHTRETLAPPAVPVRFFVKLPESINPAIAQELRHPFPFFRKKAAALFISFRIVNINFLVSYVVITTEYDLRIFLS